jgi:excisionase family DNA binding protein
VSIHSVGIPKQRPLAYSVNDAAEVSGLCRSQLYSLMRKGELPFIEVGGRRLIHDSAIRKLLQIKEESAS